MPVRCSAGALRHARSPMPYREQAMKITGGTPPGHPALLRSINHRRLLQMVRDCGPISRSALAEELELSRVTVSAIVRRLHDLGLVHEAGRSRAGTVGRRAVLLDLNPRLGSVLAVDVNADEMRTSAADLRGRQIAVGRSPAPESLDDLVSAAARGRTYIERSHEVRVHQLVVAVPGSVDATGVVRYAGSPAWLEGVALRDALLEELPGLPVTVTNDVNMAAVAEHRDGVAKNWKRYAFLGVRRSGIGMGLVVGGALYRGAHGRAGEIGPLRLHGEALLDTVFSRLAAESLTELARVLAVTVAVLDLDGVVMHSELEAGYDWFSELEVQLGSLVPYPVRLVPSRLGEGAVLRGATLVALDRAWPAIEQRSEASDRALEHQVKGAVDERLPLDAQDPGP